MMNPLVYIVMPCYNSEKYLLEQLMSIYYQNYTNWYIIFVNDGSTDNSENILRNWISNYNLHNKVKIINKENGGVNTAVQRGLEEVKKICNINETGNLIAFCDSDDIWTRSKLEIQVKYMLEHPECDLSYHDLMTIDENGVTKSPLLQHFYPKRDYLFLFTIKTYMTSTEMMFRMKYIDYILPMPVGLGMYQDQWTSYVFGINGFNSQFINKCLAYYRTGHSSLIKKISKTDIKMKNEIHMKYFYALKRRFPKKDINYILSYNEDRLINRFNKDYSLIHIYLIMLFKYPNIFRLGLKCQLWKFFKFGTLNPK